MKTELYDSRVRGSVRSKLAQYRHNPSEGFRMKGEIYTKTGIRGRKVPWFVELHPYGEPIQPEPTDLPFTSADIRNSVNRYLKKRMPLRLYQQHKPTIADHLGREHVQAIRESIAA